MSHYEMDYQIQEDLAAAEAQARGTLPPVLQFTEIEGRIVDVLTAAREPMAYSTIIVRLHLPYTTPTERQETDRVVKPALKALRERQTIVCVDRAWTLSAPAGSAAPLPREGG